MDSKKLYDNAMEYSSGGIDPAEEKRLVRKVRSLNSTTA